MPHPFEAFQAATDLYQSENAVALAHAARLAYRDAAECAETATQWGFPRSQFIERRESQCLVMASNNAIVATFRGIEPNKLKDWMSDLDLQFADGPFGVVMRSAPGVRAIQPDLLGLELRHQPFGDSPKQRVVQQFHVVLVARDATGESLKRWLPVHERTGSRCTPGWYQTSGCAASVGQEVLDVLVHHHAHRLLEGITDVWLTRKRWSDPRGL